MSELPIKDLKPSDFDFFQEALEGLKASHKKLSSKFLYDLQGSDLFEKICNLDEYYLTRTEMQMMKRYAPDMAREVGRNAMMIELGSGSSLKTRLLLDELVDPACYVPVDISKTHLKSASEELNSAYPAVEVLPVCADFTDKIDLPEASRSASRKVVYFPGSTIGNFSRKEAIHLLANMARLCGSGGGLLIGVDLKKDVEILERAYNDKSGVTKEFNLNILRRMNKELGANFNIEHFRHHAFYNETEGRIEMHLISQKDQVVMLRGHRIPFKKNESICTEYSYKYSREEFSDVAKKAGWNLKKSWQDSRNMFSIHYLTATADFAAF